MATTTKIQPGLGSGIYTYSEAAHLLCVDVQRIRRWAEGYVYKLNGEERRKNGVLHREPTRACLLTFYDLIELIFVREFRNAGVSLQHLVETAALLRDRWNTPYPFAFERLNTEGSQLLLEAGEHYENVAMHQHVFRFIEEFFKNIEFEDNRAQRWWPLGAHRLVLIDPRRSFGAPIDARFGVRTETLYKAYCAEDNDVQAVADWYEVTVESVRAAVEFEEQCSRAA